MISPESGETTPAMIFERVLFPAPFSPMSAWTSPLTTEKSTSFSAWVPWKRLLTHRMSSRAVIGALERKLFIHFSGVLSVNQLGLENVLVVGLESRLLQHSQTHFGGLVCAQRVEERCRVHAIHHLLYASGRSAQAVDADEDHLIVPV